MTSTTTRRRRSINPMIEDLGTYTVADAAQLASELVEPLKLYPGKAKKFTSISAKIVNWSTENNVNLLADLTGDVAARMLRDLSGAKTLTRENAPAKLDKLHRVRNALTALRGVVVMASDLGHRRSDRPAQDSLAAGLPAVAPRSGTKRRPLTDDEIMLTRILVEIDQRENGSPRTVIAYLIAESGVPATASTRLLTDALDHATEPRRVKVQGVWGFKERNLKLDLFVARNMARALAHLRTGSQPLTYTGNKPGSKEAVASLTPVVTRFLRRAGIDSPEVTQMSLCLWRASHALIVHSDIVKARKFHGGGTLNLLADLEYKSDEREIHKNRIRILDRATDELIAVVRADKFYDRV